MKEFTLVLILFTSILLTSCGSSTDAPPGEDAGVYLPSDIGNTWVYELARSNHTYRSIVADTTVEGIDYFIMQDSTTYMTNGQPASYVGRSYLRSDDSRIYSLASLSPRIEAIELDTTVGATWTVLQDTTMTSIATLWQYRTVALLPSFSVDSMTFNDVLQIETTESFPDHPEFGTTMYELYYAKYVGQVEILDSTHSIIGLKLGSYKVR